VVITPTFTANFNTNFGTNAAAAQAAWIAAADVFTSQFSDAIHINITVDAVTKPGVFGESFPGLVSISYADLFARVSGDAVTQNDHIAVGPGGSMPSSDPTNGIGTWWLTRAQAKALGYIPDDMSDDGGTTFGVTNPFTFSGAIAPGTYDFQGVAAHEISEVMGRMGLSGGTVGTTTNSFSLIDNFSYTAPGTKGLRGGPGNNFSIDSGMTLLKLFNDPTVNHLDTRDWASGTNDAFNQFSGSGVANPVSAVDLQIMDVIGYDLTPTWHGPGTLTTVKNIVALAGHFSTGDERDLVVVGTASGKIHEIFWKTSQVGIEGQDDLPVAFGGDTIVSVGSLYNSDQQRHVVLVGKTDGKVQEIFWKPTTVGIEGHDDLPVTFTPGTIVAVSGLYNTSDQRHVALVGTTAGKVHEIFWKADTVGVEGDDDLPVAFAAGSIVGVTAFYNSDDERHVVVVATSAGMLHEIFWKSDTVGVEGHDDLPVKFDTDSIVAVSGFYDANTQRHVVAVGTKDGKVHEIYWKSGTVGIEAHNTVAQFSAGSIVSLAGFYSASDRAEHIVVGLTDGLVRELWATPAT
jgi:hypothetical protein